VTGLARYVPTAALAWPGPAAIGDQPLHREVDGTLVFIDVSGFTALSERLAQRGKVGAEQLTDVLNAVFGSMLDLAAARGGTLLKFGGDALFLLYTGPDHAAQAASSAVEMRSSLAAATKIPGPAGRLHLRMSVGVHTGPVDLFLVGDSHRELVVAGPATTAVASMEAAASAGQILLSPTTVERLPSTAAGDPLGPGRLLRWRAAHAPLPDPASDGQTPHDAALFVPTALRALLAAAEPESEHRTAGVAFLRYTGLDALLAHDPQDAADALGTLVTTAQVAADEQGVTFLATDLAEDGGKIILVAGFPVTAEDDQGRLLRAACDVVSTAARQAWPLTVQAGVNRGHVFAGAVGSDRRATVTVMGDTVNLAARVMARAEAATVLATPAVLDAAQTLFATQAVEPFMVKGKSRPVTAYAVGEEIGPRPPRGLGSLPFLGRDAELGMLVDAMAGACSSRGSVVTVVADAGMGKSRLLQESLTAGPSLAVLAVRAEPYGAATPYRPLRDPLRALLDLAHAEPSMLPALLADRVSSLDPALAPWAPLIGDVVGVAVEPTAATRDLDPEFRPERTADAVVALLAAAVPGPLLVTFDDAHYSDDATAGLMARVEQACDEHAWLLVAARREEEMDGYRPAGGTIVRLEPLSDEATRALVLHGTEAAPLRPHDVDSLVGRVAGNPLFLEETLRGLREHGDLDALPSSLEDLVTAQIDALPPLARRLVRRASVLGRSFRVAVLADLFEGEDFALDEATRKELSEILEEDGAGRLRFRHALLRDGAYDSLPYEQRRALHRLAAKSILTHSRRRPEDYADALALHYSLAGDHEQTWRWSKLAGDEARRAYANDDAATQYQRALAAGRRLAALPPREYFATWLTLGEVLEQAGRYPDALQAYKDARSAASTATDVARVMARRAVVYDGIALFSRALHGTAVGMRVAQESREPDTAAVLADLWTIRAGVLVKQERYTLAWQAAVEGEQNARAAQDVRGLASALTLKAEAAHGMGRDDADLYSQEALRVLEGKGLLRLEAVTTATLGVIAFYRGEWDTAVAAYNASRRVFLQIGDLRTAATLQSNLVEVLVLQQRHDEVDGAVEEAVRTFRAIGVDGTRHFTEMLHARSLLDRGDAAAAGRIAREASTRLWDLGAQGQGLLADLVCAEAALRGGEPAEALAMLDASADRYSGEWQIVRAPASLTRGRVLEALGRQDEAIAEWQHGLSTARSMGMTFEAAQLTLALGSVGAASPGEVDDAVAQLKGLGVRTLPREVEIA
jgi:class 3 adenylate cyclase/tetratricopeptide (TPR) repeat protein